MPAQCFPSYEHASSHSRPKLANGVLLFYVFYPIASDIRHINGVKPANNLARCFDIKGLSSGQKLKIHKSNYMLLYQVWN